jgi:hypothetical protein
VSKNAVAIRGTDGTLALLLRVVRSPSGIYVVFAAGQHRKRHDPHTSWHRDGRFHHKSFDREIFERRKRQPLEGFVGVESFITTSTNRTDAPHLPACDPAEFTNVMEVPITVLKEAPHGTQVHVELLGPESEPVVPTPGHRLIQRHVVADENPRIAISLYDVSIPR